MKRIEFTIGDIIASFSNDVFLLEGTLGNGEQCSALSCPLERIPKINKYIHSKFNIPNIKNHFLNPLLGYSIQDDHIYFVYQIICSNSLIDWYNNENGDFEKTEELKIKGFEMIYQICYAIYETNMASSFIGINALRYIMLTDNDHPIIYGYGLPEIFGDRKPDSPYEEDCQCALKLAQKILPSIYENSDYLHFCNRIINFEIELPLPKESLWESISDIREYSKEQFDYISVEELEDENNNNNEYDDDKSISSETNSQDKDDGNVDEYGHRKLDTSDPTKNIGYWKKGEYSLFYCQMDKTKRSIKILTETDSYNIYNNNLIGLKNCSIDYAKYREMAIKNIDTPEAPSYSSVSLEQNSKFVKSYPSKQGILLIYRDDFVPITYFQKEFDSTQKAILVIRAIYSLIQIETLFGGHGFLNKYLFTFKKDHKAKNPKVRILGSGLFNIINDKTNDLKEAKEIFNEFGWSTPILLEKMAQCTSFVQLYKELVTDFSWFPEDTDVDTFFGEIFSYIVIGSHPLYTSEGIYVKETHKEFELFMLNFHHMESYDALEDDKNPIISVKTCDEYNTIKMLNNSEKGDDNKIIQFQKLDPTNIDNDDDLAYWAYCKATGKHLQKDIEEGKKLLEQASPKSSLAKYYLSLLTNDDHLMQKACDEKYPPAMGKIAVKDGFNLELIQKAILLGSIDAINSLGVYYFEKEKYKLAYGFLYTAANLNHPDAQWRLAMMIEKSIVSGVIDIDSAEVFYLASASQGHPLGLYHYARFEEIYNSMKCYTIYQLALKQGAKEAEIPIIAHDISKKNLTAEEIYNIVDSKDPSFRTELLFRIAYELPKNKEELAIEIRKKAKDQMDEDDTDHFYAGFGLYSVYSCLREMTELSLNWSGIDFIDVHRLLPSNIVLCWAQDFPHPSIDTINLISQETLIKLPKDAMIIRNKFSKLSKQEDCKNDPFFLIFYLLHIQNHHANVDSRLEQFIEATKEKLSDMKYDPYYYIYERKKIKEHSPLGDGRKIYIINKISKIEKEENKEDNEEIELRRRGIFSKKTTDPFKSKSFSRKKEYADEKEIKKYIKLYPQILCDTKIKFFRFSQFYRGSNLRFSISK